jgi:TctA family transporter
LTLSHGSSLIFLSRPISAILLLAAAGIVLVPIAMQQMRMRRLAV